MDLCRPFFDAGHYGDTLEHYCSTGWREGRNPSPVFDTAQYLKESGIDGLGLNPLVHFALRLLLNDTLPAGAEEARLQFEVAIVTQELDRYFYIATQVPQGAVIYDPVSHYIDEGWALGLNPSPIFDSKAYVTAHDLRGEALNPLAHDALRRIVEMVDIDRTVSGLPFSDCLIAAQVDAAYYAEHHGTGPAAAQHFLKTGALMGLSPSAAFAAGEASDGDMPPSDRMLQHATVRLRPVTPTVALDVGLPPMVDMTEPEYPEPLYSQALDDFRREVVEALFDADFYLEAYSDLPRTDFDALEHFMDYGWREGRDPSPHFSTRGYMDSNGLSEADGNPLLHYALERLRTVSTGGFQMERRLELMLTEPDFDRDYYKAAYPDIGSTSIDPLRHYVQYGWKEGRNPSPAFSSSIYAKTNGLTEEDPNPLAHRALVRLQSRRDNALEYDIIAAQLDREFYLNTYADVASAGLDPVEHYRNHGWQEGRNPAPEFGTAHYVGKHELEGGSLNPLVHRALEAVKNLGDLERARSAPVAAASAAGSFEEDIYGLHSAELGDPAPKLHRYRDMDPRLPVVLLVIFCQDPVLSRLQRTMCREYLKLDVNLVVLLHQPIRLLPEDAAVPEGVHAVVTRGNAGFDFGGWRDALALLGPMTEFPRVILTNDSLVPVSAGIGPIISAHAESTVDWLYSTSNEEFGRHGQSFLMSYNPQRLGDVALEVMTADGLETKQDVIDKIEMPLAGRLAKHGFGVDYVHDRDCYNPEVWDKNPTLHSAEELVAAGFGFVKAEYLFNHIGEMDSWLGRAFDQERISEIQDHLNRRYPKWDDEAKVGLGVPLGVPAPRRQIILFGHDANVGGAQRLLLALARTLTGVLDYDVVILLLDDGANIAQFKAVAPTFVIGDKVSRLHQVLSMCKAHGFDSCVINTTVPLVHLKTVYSYGIRTVCLVHEMADGIRTLGLTAAVEKGLPALERVVYPSVLVRDSVENAYGGPRDNVLVRPQGHFRITRADRARAENTDALLPVIADLKAAGNKIVLCVGTMEHRKGFDRFRKVALRYKAEHPEDETRFVWVGSPQRVCDVADDHAAAVGEDSVTCIPNIDETVLAAIYEVTDAYFFTSRQDAMPYAVIDAFMHGLPVVGYDGVGGCDPLIAKLGTLMPADAEEDQCVDTIRSYLIRPDGEKARTERRAFIEDSMDFDDYAVEILSLLGHYNPKVDVVVPNYQHERFLPARLNSILEQSYRYMDLLLLDDCSGDDSIAVMRKVTAPFSGFTREKFNRKNSGNSYKQWKKAVDSTSGELLWIAESDDVCSRSFLSQMVRGFADPKVTIGFSNTVFIDQDGEKFGSIQNDFEPIHPFQWDASYKVSGVAEISRSLAEANTLINVSSVMFRQSAIPRFTRVLKYRFAGDWELYMLMCREGDIFFEKGATNYFRRSKGAQTSRTAYSDLFYREHAMIRETVREIAGEAAAARTERTIRRHWSHKPVPDTDIETYLG